MLSPEHPVRATTGPYGEDSQARPLWVKRLDALFLSPRRRRSCHARGSAGRRACAAARACFCGGGAGSLLPAAPGLVCCPVRRRRRPSPRAGGRQRRRRSSRRGATLERPAHKPPAVRPVSPRRGRDDASGRAPALAGRRGRMRRHGSGGRLRGIAIPLFSGDVPDRRRGVRKTASAAGTAAAPFLALGSETLTR